MKVLNQVIKERYALYNGDSADSHVLHTGYVVRQHQARMILRRLEPRRNS